METGVLRRMLKRAKVWNTICEDVKALPEQQGWISFRSYWCQIGGEPIPENDN